MRGQYQQIVGQHAEQPGAGREPCLQRIAIGFCGKHRYIGCDTRQDLIPGNHQLQRRAVEARVLGRVPLTDYHLPVPAADRQRLPVTEALVVVGERRGELAEAAKALLVILQLFVGESRAVIEGDRRGWGRFTRITHDQATSQELRLCHVQIAVETFAKPACQTNVVGMHVSADHTVDGFASHEASEQGFPSFLGRIQIEAGIDNGPAVSVLQQPQVDVVQGSRHGKSRPPDTGRHFERVIAGVLEPAPGVSQTTVLFVNAFQSHC